jgi:hypothetical protein
VSAEAVVTVVSLLMNTVQLMFLAWLQVHYQRAEAKLEEILPPSAFPEV